MTDWISVKDRLPEDKNRVLVWYMGRRYEMPLFAEWDRSQWWDHEGLAFGDYSKHITHWQPLPEPPEAEEE